MTKKSLRKPSNWQDFEDLCKKLFGDIWKCPYEIKRNGRAGEKQFGVDVYAIPEGETQYFGIQCKGKDDYTNSQLTKKEIDSEILKAKGFKPSLKTFIFATTANKNADIEEYIRLKDIESRKNKGFKILLYHWEDLVDFIEENRDVYNWFVNGSQYKETHKVWVGFEAEKVLREIEVPLKKTITRHRYIPIDQNPTFCSISPEISLLLSSTQKFPYLKPFPTNLLGQPNQVNRSWCIFDVYIKNIGSKVIEDWKLFLDVEEGKYEKISDDSPKGGMYTIALTADYWKTRNYNAYEDEGYYAYKPFNNAPLIQKDSKSFSVKILPKLGVESIKLKWEFLARDYNEEGEIILNLKPVFHEKIIEKKVDTLDEVKDDIIDIEYLIEQIK